MNYLRTTVLLYCNGTDAVLLALYPVNCVFFLSSDASMALLIQTWEEMHYKYLLTCVFQVSVLYLNSCFSNNVLLSLHILTRYLYFLLPSTRNSLVTFILIHLRGIINFLYFASLHSACIFVSGCFYKMRKIGL